MTIENLKELEKLKGARTTDIKNVRPTFYFDNNATLFLECPWRLVVNDDEIIVGDIEFAGQNTHNEGMKILKNVILNKRIIDIEVKAGLKDVKITFEGNLTLEIFVLSALYESWNLHIGERNFIGIPGGQIAVF